VSRPAIAVNLGGAFAGVNRVSIDLPRPVSGARGVVFDAGPRAGVSGGIRAWLGRHVLVGGDVYRLPSRGEGRITLPESGASGLGAFTADATFAARAWRHATVVSASAGLHFDLGRRWSGFVSGGIAAQRTTSRVEAVLTCTPRTTGGCDDRPDIEIDGQVTTNRTSAQLIYGLDAAVTPRVMAFTELRWTNPGRSDFADDDVHLVGGVRIAVRTRVESREPPQVRERARRVRSGALLGAIGGSVAGFIAGTARGPGADMGAAGHSLLFGMWGAGAGAALGWLLH
jgi:opacity protein-like surface antigen